MKLELDPYDLRPEFQNAARTDQEINTRDVTFEKLTQQAQAAVTAVGRAVFYAWDRMTYNAVYPPHVKTS